MGLTADSVVPVSDAHEGPDARLRIVQLNAGTVLEPEWDRRRAEVVAWIERLAPDVVCLEEIHAVGRRSERGALDPRRARRPVARRVRRRPLRARLLERPRTAVRLRGAVALAHRLVRVPRPAPRARSRRVRRQGAVGAGARPHRGPRRVRLPPRRRAHCTRRTGWSGPRDRRRSSGDPTAPGRPSAPAPCRRSCAATSTPSPTATRSGSSARSPHRRPHDVLPGRVARWRGTPARASRSDWTTHPHRGRAQRPPQAHRLRVRRRPVPAHRRRRPGARAPSSRSTSRSPAIQASDHAGLVVDVALARPPGELTVSRRRRAPIAAASRGLGGIAAGEPAVVDTLGREQRAMRTMIAALRTSPNTSNHGRSTSGRPNATS